MNRVAFPVISSVRILYFIFSFYSISVRYSIFDIRYTIYDIRFACKCRCSCCEINDCKSNGTQEARQIHSFDHLIRFNVCFDSLRYVRRQLIIESFKGRVRDSADGFGWQGKHKVYLTFNVNDFSLPFSRRVNVSAATPRIFLEYRVPLCMPLNLFLCTSASLHLW